MAFRLRSRLAADGARQFRDVLAAFVILEDFPPHSGHRGVVEVGLCAVKDKHTLSEGLHFLYIDTAAGHDVVLSPYPQLFVGCRQRGDPVLHDGLRIELAVKVASDGIDVDVGPVLADGDTAVRHVGGAELVGVGQRELHFALDVAVDEHTHQGDALCRGEPVGVIEAVTVDGRHNGIVDVDADVCAFLLAPTEVGLAVDGVGLGVDVALHRPDDKATVVGRDSRLDCLEEADDGVVLVGHVAHVHVKLHRHRRVGGQKKLCEWIQLDVQPLPCQHTQHLGAVFGGDPSVIDEVEALECAGYFGIVGLRIEDSCGVGFRVVAHLRVKHECGSEGRRKRV